MSSITRRRVTNFLQLSGEHKVRLECLLGDLIGLHGYTISNIAHFTASLYMILLLDMETRISFVDIWLYKPT